MTVITERHAFRLRPADLDNVAAIAAGLRTKGRPFVRRTDVIRHALALAAAAAVADTAATPGAVL